MNSDARARLAEHYVELRKNLCLFEEELGRYEGEQKEYDKGVVLMKAGAKLIKKELWRYGFLQLGKKGKELANAIIRQRQS
jgi:hypothetical protein